VHDRPLDPKLSFFTDEAHFNLSGYVNSQKKKKTKKNRYWTSENSHALIHLPLYDQTVGVWCAISANRITGPIFYEGALDVQQYVNKILNPFSVNLAPGEERFGFLLCKTSRLRTHLRKLSEHYAVSGEINGEDRICGPLDPQI
jgi:hypothetical protein